MSELKRILGAKKPPSEPAAETHRFYDAVKQNDQPEAGFIVGAQEGRFVYSWMNFNGAFRSEMENKCCLRMGKEEVVIEFPEKFQIERFEEVLRMARLQRIYQKPDEGLRINVVEVVDDEFGA